MAGGTYNHGLICGNIFGEIRSRLIEQNSLCTAMSSEIKLHVVSENSYLYPDTMVIYDEVEKSVAEKNAVTNPVLVIEVLSKSTATYDRGDKFHLYRQIPSLREYVLIEQDKAQVEIYKREGGLWKITRIQGVENTLLLSSLELEIDFQRIYYRVDFEQV
jgi:Uma2 family endonuclease